MRDHCWHGIGHNTGEDREQVCCFCGRHYNPAARIPENGHGKFSPDTIPQAKPKNDCVQLGER